MFPLWTATFASFGRAKEEHQAKAKLPTSFNSVGLGGEGHWARASWPNRFGGAEP